MYKNRFAMQDFFNKHCIRLKDEPYLLDDYWSGFNINILFQKKPMLSIDNVLPLNLSFIIDALKARIFFFLRMILEHIVLRKILFSHHFFMHLM